MAVVDLSTPEKPRRVKHELLEVPEALPSEPCEAQAVPAGPVVPMDTEAALCPDPPLSRKLLFQEDLTPEKQAPCLQMPMFFLWVVLCR